MARSNSKEGWADLEIGDWLRGRSGDLVGVFLDEPNWGEYQLKILQSASRQRLRRSAWTVTSIIASTAEGALRNPPRQTETALAAAKEKEPSGHVTT